MSSVPNNLAIGGKHTTGGKKRSGKVIRLFTVEITDACSTPEVYTNPSNPYTQLSGEERLKDFNEIFALLWAESYRDISRSIHAHKKACN